MYKYIQVLLAALSLGLGSNVWAQATPDVQPVKDEPKIHMIYLGGDDCPPCRAWRATELPKLQKSEAFKAITFSYVQKTIKSPVPMSFFLPDEVKPYKEKLDQASRRRSGSSQTAILVNGDVFDYYWGTRSAEEVEAMILSIKSGGRYPFKTCLKFTGAFKACTADA